MRTKEEIKARQKRWYQENKKEILARQKRWYQENKKEILAKTKKYWHEHKEEKKVTRKKYLDTHKEEIKAWQDKYNDEHKEERKLYWKKYYQDPKHKEERRIYHKIYYKTENAKKLSRFRNAKRRAMKLNQTPPWADLEKIKEIYRNCPEGYEVDHIHPISRGGLHVDYNLQYLTEEDNRIKSNKILYIRR